jgi:phasin family protein
MIAGYEKVLDAQQSFFDFAQSVSTKAIEGSKRLAALNFAAAEAALAENTEQVKSMLSESKDPMEAMRSFTPAKAQPATEKMSAYLKHAYEISSQTGTEIGGLVQQQTQAGRQSFEQVLATMGQNVPAGAKSYFENMNNMFKAAAEQVIVPEVKAKRK